MYLILAYRGQVTSKVMSKITEIILVETGKHSVSYEYKKIEKVEGVANEKALSMSYLLDSYRKLLGRVLTTIDASITGTQQNKAIKDIIKKAFSDETEFASNMVYDQDEICKIANDSFESLSPKEQEEALNSEVDIQEVLEMSGKKLV